VLCFGVRHGPTIGTMTNQKKAPAAEVLDPKDCWNLLAELSVGRLAVTANGHPDVFPVNYKVDGESLIFRTGSGTKREALDADPVVAFEVDKVSAEFGLAWSIVIKGRAQKTEFPSEALNSFTRALFPWQGTSKDSLIRIIPESISGRRFTEIPSTMWETLDDATRAGLE
jgi:nitroimidazol reductase NimA-like FMN-containing flavoprotein (pyridoxamine 5'-phosphate oxidase superfamily)